MSLSITPIRFQPSPPDYSNRPSPEDQLKEVEIFANDMVQYVPKAKQQAYRLMIQSELRFIRSQITTMKAEGKSEYEIHRALPGLFENFYAASNRYIDENKLYIQNKSSVCNENHVTANKINQCVREFDSFEREPPMIQDVEPGYLQGYLSDPVYLPPPKVDQSLQAASARFLQNRAMENVVRARVVTATLNAVGTVIKETAAVVLGCRGEEGQKNCKAVLGYAKTLVKESAATVLGCRGEGRKTCEVVLGYIKTVGEKVKPTLTRMMSGQALTQRLGELGADPVTAQQYVQDCNSLRLSAIFAGSVTGTSRLIRAAETSLETAFSKSIIGAKRLTPTQQTNHNMNRMVGQETLLLPEDIGFHPATFHSGIPGNKLRGSMKIHDDTLTVYVDFINMDETSSTGSNMITNLRKIAKVNKVKTLAIDAEFVNERLKAIMAKRYGGYIDKSLTDLSKELNSYQVFRIPITE